MRGGFRAWKSKGLTLEHSAAIPRGYGPAAALKLVADCFRGEAAAAALDQVGSRPAAHRLPRSIQDDRRDGRPNLQHFGLRNTLVCLHARPGLVYRLEQVVIGPANHSYTGLIMRLMLYATLLCPWYLGSSSCGYRKRQPQLDWFTKPSND